MFGPAQRLLHVLPPHAHVNRAGVRGGPSFRSGHPGRRRESTPAVRDRGARADAASHPRSTAGTRAASRRARGLHLTSERCRAAWCRQAEGGDLQQAADRRAHAVAPSGAASRPCSRTWPPRHLGPRLAGSLHDCIRSKPGATPTPGAVQLSRLRADQAIGSTFPSSAISSVSTLSVGCLAVSSARKLPSCLACDAVSVALSLACSGPSKTL